MMQDVLALTTYDGESVEVLAARAGAPQVFAVESCSSTMDLAHDMATGGAPSGTVVVALRQEAGRGRTGKSWVSQPGAGVWASVLLRPRAVATGGVLSLRVGLELAARLDAYAPAPIQLKWPNDLYLERRKLAGVLTEARWRGEQLEWIVVGVGVNVRVAPDELTAASLDPATRCADVLVAVSEAILAAHAGGAALSDDELQRYAARDLALGREIVSPLAGVVQGITAAGGLRVRTVDGEVVAVAGSLVFQTL